MFENWGAGPGRGDWWVCPRCDVTFEPRQVALGAWHEVKREAMSARVKFNNKHAIIIL